MAPVRIRVAASAHARSYVPIKPDYSDLCVFCPSVAQLTCSYDVLAYFEGTADGQGSHREQAEQLAESGRLWAMDHWRRGALDRALGSLTRAEDMVRHRTPQRR